MASILKDVFKGVLQAFGILPLRNRTAKEQPLISHKVYRKNRKGEWELVEVRISQ